MPFYRSVHSSSVGLGRCPAQLFRCFVVTQQCRKLKGVEFGRSKPGKPKCLARKLIEKLKKRHHSPSSRVEEHVKSAYGTCNLKKREFAALPRAER